MKAFGQFYPKVREFYDFKHFELQNVYADADKVFAISKAAIASTNDSILLCEQFTFKQGKIIEVRLYFYDYDNRPVHITIGEAAQARKQSTIAASDDDAAIRALEERFAAAFNAGDVDGIMKNYISDNSLVVFDVVPRKQCLGADAYRKDWEDLFSHFKGRPKIAITISASPWKATSDLVIASSASRERICKVIRSIGRYALPMATARSGATG